MRTAAALQRSPHGRIGGVEARHPLTAVDAVGQAAERHGTQPEQDCLAVGDVAETST